MNQEDISKIFDKTVWSTDFDWEDDSYVSVAQVSKISERISAKRNGLISLANQLTELANSDFKSIVYDPFPGDLEEGSLALEIIKTQHQGQKNPDVTR